MFMKYINLFILSFFSFHLCYAQSYSIKGKVTDTLNKNPLPYAAVTLIHAKDSILETFTRTAEDGSFTLHPTQPGAYILMTTFPSFVDFVQKVDVDKPETDLGQIPMISRTNLLKEVIIKREMAAIKIKGDTTEYVADSFNVKEGANVEDLLKKLPGIQVDKNGQITAQGETVQKILVDGEEFFSDDPAVVTKGLQANAVDKVQVFDKKSDQAEFTGVDDGQRTKTINLKLKADRKKGYFGKVDAGGGTDGYFQNQAMFNAFKGNRQLSIFGIASNTDKVGLGWNDRSKYSSGNNTEVSDDGNIYTFFNSNDEFDSWDGTYNGQGLPKVWTVGLHYANKWNEDKQHLAGNYRYALENIDIGDNTTTQYILPDSQYISKQQKYQFSKVERHNIDGSYEWKLDSSSSLKLTLDANSKKIETKSVYNTDVLAGNDVLTNHNGRDMTSDLTTQNINADLLYRKKFAKAGRTISIDVKENYNTKDGNGILKSTTDFYDSVGQATDESFINQKKIDKANMLAFQAKATYTEPLSKALNLQLDYGVNVNNSSASNYSYNPLPGTDNYNQIDSLYSSNYTFNVLSNTGGASLKYNNKKITASVGTDVTNTHYSQTDHFMLDTTYHYNYLNFFPNASFTYKISRQTSLHISYYGQTHQPTIDQIQPLRQNTDPLNITIGNPNLKQELNNSVNAYYRNYKVLTNRYIWAGMYFNVTNNDISTAQFIDSGIRRMQYINVNGDYTGSAYGGYSFKLQKLGMYLGINANIGMNHINSYINNVKNTSDNNSYTLRFTANYAKDKKFSIDFDPSITYNDNRATVSTYTTSFWTSENTLSGSVELPLKFQIGSDINWYLRQQTAIFTDNNNVLRWNAYVSKKFLKNGQLELKAAVYDILNQNIGFTRTADNNVITQDNYNTIRRYGMMSLIWNFSKTPAGQQQANSDDE